MKIDATVNTRWDCAFPGNTLRMMNTSEIIALIFNPSQRATKFREDENCKLSCYTLEIDNWFLEDLKDELDARIPPRETEPIWRR